MRFLRRLNYEYGNAVMLTVTTWIGNEEYGKCFIFQKELNPRLSWIRDVFKQLESDIKMNISQSRQ